MFLPLSHPALWARNPKLKRSWNRKQNCFAGVSFFALCLRELCFVVVLFASCVEVSPQEQSGAFSKDNRPDVLPSTPRTPYRSDAATLAGELSRATELNGVARQSSGSASRFDHCVRLLRRGRAREHFHVGEDSSKETSVGRTSRSGAIDAQDARRAGSRRLQLKSKKAAPRREVDICAAIKANRSLSGIG